MGSFQNFRCVPKKVFPKTNSLLCFSLFCDDYYPSAPIGSDHHAIIIIDPCCGSSPCKNAAEGQLARVGARLEASDDES
jgi:hypothetical protein